jgi:hypothetical protein
MTTTVMRDVPLRPYNVKDLMQLYDVSRWVINSWIASIRDRLGDQTGRYFTIAQVKIIFEVYGWPQEQAQ